MRWLYTWHSLRHLAFEAVCMGQVNSLQIHQRNTETTNRTKMDKATKRPKQQPQQRMTEALPQLLGSLGSAENPLCIHKALFRSHLNCNLVYKTNSNIGWWNPITSAEATWGPCPWDCSSIVSQGLPRCLEWGLPVALQVWTPRAEWSEAPPQGEGPGDTWQQQALHCRLEPATHRAPRQNLSISCCQ